MKKLPSALVLWLSAALPLARAQVFILQPSSDLGSSAVVGSPNTTSLYTNIDDQPEFTDDGDSSFVRSNNTSGYYTCGYTSAATGKVSKVLVNYYACTKAPSGSIQVLLYDGATLIGTGSSHSLTSSYALYSDTFTGLSASALANLQTKVEFTNPTGEDSLRVSALWLQGTVTGKLGWVINSAYVTGVQGIAHPTGQTSPTGSWLANHFFNSTNSIIFTNNPSTNPIPSGYTAQGGMKFPGYASTISGYYAFSPTLTAGDIDSHVSVVIYDDEHWSQTPAGEQADPSAYTEDFADLAHTHFYATTASPSRDLAEGQSNYPGMGTLDNYYFNVDDVPTWSADAPSDYFIVQMQVHMSDGTYATTVGEAVTQAVAANPYLKIVPVLSTNYGTATQMYSAVTGTVSDSNVWGYFIDVSGGTTGYQEVVDFLYQLYEAGY